MTFLEELQLLINRHSLENGSDTPDFILAEYLQDCLITFDKMIRDREKWYGRGSQIGSLTGDDMNALRAVIDDPNHQGV